MAEFVYFTEEQKQRANSVDLVDFLPLQGEKLLPSGRDKRLERDHSITVRGNRWYDHAAERGGYAIDLVKRLYDLSFPEAVSLLLGGEQGAEYKQYNHKEIDQRKPFSLPEANLDMRRVYAYLMKQRHISSNIITEFVRKKLLYEDKQYHNAVFVGVDKQGIPRHAHKKSTLTMGSGYRGNVEGSNPYYSFHYISDDVRADTLYVFEAPIDMLSYITMNQNNWKNHHYVACNGVSEKPVLKLLEAYSQINCVKLCMDHDIAGIEAAEKIKDLLLKKRDYVVSIILPEQKDWNEDLKLRNGVHSIPAERHPQLRIRDNLCAEVSHLTQLLSEYHFTLENISDQYERLRRRMERGWCDDACEWLKDLTAHATLLSAAEYQRSGDNHNLKQIEMNLWIGYRAYQNKGTVEHKLSDISISLKSLFLLQEQVLGQGEISRAKAYEALAMEFLCAAVLLEQHRSEPEEEQEEYQGLMCFDS